MICKGLAELRKSALPLAMATLMVAGTYVALTSTTAAAATSGSRALSSGATPNGVWPGVGKICEPGPGGASSVRGVSSKTINIAVFNDAANTIEPGLEAEFPQQAKAFAAWCNASGGINGRKIVIDNRDAALFNAAQQMTTACQSDFMAVGGGMALDQPSVPIREKCGLGQITGYVVSNASDLATLQVDPSGINTNSVTSGWFGALAKAYPKAVKAAGMGGQNDASILQPETKYEFGAEAQGWKVVDFPEPPITVENWAPYVEDYQSKGVQALWPADSGNFVPFAQAMTTAGYHPAFVALGTQFADAQTQQAVVDNPSLPPVYVETSWWPLSMASQNPSTEQLVNVMHTYAKGDTVDFDERGGGRGVAPVGQVGLGLWRQPHGDVRTEPRSSRDELGRRRHSGADCQLDALQREPPALAVLRPHEGRSEGVDLRQGDHPAHAVHLELQPQERRPPDLATAATTELLVSMGSSGRGGGCKLHSLAPSGD